MESTFLLPSIRAKCSPQSLMPGFSFGLRRRGQGSADQQGRDSCPLPLLHALHLQTEGGETDQQVGHFIYLWDQSHTVSSARTPRSPHYPSSTGMGHRWCPFSQGAGLLQFQRTCEEARLFW